MTCTVPVQYIYRACRVRISRMRDIIPMPAAKLMITVFSTKRNAGFFIPHAIYPRSYSIRAMAATELKKQDAFSVKK